ncbi:MAG: hypothetical protein R3D00_09490 [Bacteroidia bacterium]
MNNLRSLGVLTLILLSINSLRAEAPVGVKRKQASGFRVSSDCLPPSASAQLDVNNVRALLHNGGDMWWDLVGDPRYEVPKGSNRHSMFASSLWIGGLDESGQLRVAAQTYRQSGIDFWPGPLSGGASGGTASTNQETCEKYDEMFKINKTEIDAFRAAFANRDIEPFNLATFPNVQNWPAIGNENSNLGSDSDGFTLEAFRPDGSVLYAAPFVNVDSDPFTYNPANGDYPDIQGDQAIWWIVNDKGNVHTETGGQPIGIEIHMLAFAFTTANAVNDMTFYLQTVINRAAQPLVDTYMGQWVDSDIGFAFNDYVGCDTTKGLGYGYNATANDAGANGYGLNPPACGVDFFQGPLADRGDGVDNDKDGIVDEDGETIIMSKFIYYNNDFSLTGNPEVAQHFYGYLTGFWKDGTSIVDNYKNGTGEGNGYGPSDPGDPTNYMFSGDPCTGQGWTEANSDNPTNEDRRFLQSAGPFTLQAGAVNEIVTGVVWARGFYNDQFGSVCELLKADEIAQALFDANFELLDGPDAPEVTVSEYDKELLLSWTYPEALRLVRNNYNESYRQDDPVLVARDETDPTFEFEGYIVYQLADATVGPNELNDPDRARVVTQCDIKNGIGTIVNRLTQQVEGLSEPIITDEVMVQGKDNGIVHSVKVDRDLFALSGDTRLKNYTTYYFGVIAYAYNNITSDGRKFVPGNRFFKVSSGLPHIVDFERVGTSINSNYGDGIAVTQLSGIGNGGVFVRLDPETETEILNNGVASQIKFAPGTAPIEVKITDPKKVTGHYYRVRVVKDQFVETVIVSQDTTTGVTVADTVKAEWIVEESDNANGPFKQIYAATYRIRNDGSAPRPMPLTGTERVIEEQGFSISVKDVPAAGDTVSAATSGFIGAELTFDEPTQNWLTGLPDNDDFFGGIWNWVQGSADGRVFKDQEIYDRNDVYQTILGGRWAPYCLARTFNNDPQGGGTIGPCLPISFPDGNRQMSPARLINLPNLPDVDIVFTADKSKWSRCVVIETSPNSGLGSGAWQLSAKWRDNVNKEGQSEGTKTLTNHGMGWFPGYAINVNTGERLNIFFGESEWDQLNRGNDMIWNPTSSFGTNLERVGGRHYVWVTNQRYDGCENIRKFLQNADYKGTGGFSDAIFFDQTGNSLSNAYEKVAWVSVPMLNSGFDITSPENIPTDARVSLRQNQPFRSRPGTSDVPTFEFNTADYAVQTNQTEIAKDALEKVLVVPNPYYAYSSYETGQLDNRVKITNLPQKCRVSIFTINGLLVRQYTKDSDNPDQDWDLKNQSGVPVASGVYIIHVDANIDGQNLGEKVVKLFAVMRQIDLDSF